MREHQIELCDTCRKVQFLLAHAASTNARAICFVTPVTKHEEFRAARKAVVACAGNRSIGPASCNTTSPIALTQVVL
jgi:hypothetical protein